MLSSFGLHRRATFLRAVRRFFYEEDFLEVDTPVRNPVLIPEANIEPIGADGAFLQASPEQCMKRILSLGEKRIFQIAPCFRRNERGRKHLEEFTMLEWYRADADYEALMADCERLVRFVVAEMFDGVDRTLPERLAGEYLEGAWHRISVAEAFDQFCPMDMEEALATDNFDLFMVEYIEPNLGLEKPTVLYDYPVEMASLARKKAANPRFAERFELYMHGIELANGFSELTDASEQRYRFQEELVRIDGAWQAGMPERFLMDLENLEEAAGIALGLDRLLMLLADKERIGDVVSFTPEDFVA